MPKAYIKRPGGASIIIEGTADEVAELIQKIEGKPDTARDRERVSHKTESKLTKLRTSLPDLLISLIDGGFFRKPQELSTIKTKLAEMGHVYPATTLAPALLRQVRKRNIRRIKQDNRWFYTG